MTPSAETAPRRPLRRLAIATALAAAALAAFGAALAGSAPDKPYSAFISAPASESATTTQATTSVGGSVGLRLQNDTRQQNLGSANVTLMTPAGAVPPASVTLVTPGRPASATVVGDVIQLRNLNVRPGRSAFVRFGVPCTAEGASYSLAIQVKQSNDFNGTGNDLNPANAPPVLLGVGACVPCPPGQTCTASTSTNASTATASGSGSSSGDQIRVSLAAPDAAVVNCDRYAETTETVEFDLTNAAGVSSGGLKTVQLLIKNPSKQASQYKVCFQADDGAAAKILPTCTFPGSGGSGGSTTPRNAPCALAPESVSGKVRLTAIAPPGDPWIKG